MLRGTQPMKADERRRDDLRFIYLFAKTMLYSIKFRQNINMHGLLETAGYLNTSYADP